MLMLNGYTLMCTRKTHWDVFNMQLKVNRTISYITWKHYSNLKLSVFAFTLNVSHLKSSKIQFHKSFVWSNDFEHQSVHDTNSKIGKAAKNQFYKKLFFIKQIAFFFHIVFKYKIKHVSYKYYSLCMWCYVKFYSFL